MNKKIIVAASIIAIISIVLSVTSNSALDESTISQTIFVDAVYDPKNKIVKITYNAVSYTHLTLPTTPYV